MLFGKIRIGDALCADDCKIGFRETLAISLGDRSRPSIGFG
jgi:hypothetical protein